MRERIPVPRREPEPPADELVALQRGLGNQAVAQLLRAPAPTQFGGKTVTKLDDDGWAAAVRAQNYSDLLEDLAGQLDAEKLEDVKATGGKVHGAARLGPTYLKPGLNFVRNFGSRGRTYYVHDGKLDTVLPDTPDGDAPIVVVVFSELAFDPDNKAFTLGVLRHEIEHAVHYRMAADLLKTWRDGPKKQPFRTWLKDNKAISAVDRALAQERLGGAKSGTEALANLEGFMAAFSTERAGIELADHPATEELGDVAEFYVNAPMDVRPEVRKRLAAYAAKLTGERRATFLAKLKELRAATPGIADLADPILKRP